MGANLITHGGCLEALTRRFRIPMSPAEVLLWSELKGRRLRGYRFDRRRQVHHYVVDFYCSELQLAVDIVGAAQGSCIDEERTIRLRLSGIAFLPFAEDEVLHNLDGVVSKIRQAIRHLPWK